jgi:RHS repeat-associated protein
VVELCGVQSRLECQFQYISDQKLKPHSADEIPVVLGTNPGRFVDELLIQEDSMKSSSHETSSMLKALTLVLLAALLPLQVNATIRGMEKTTKANVSVGSAGSSGADWASESMFTGNVNLSIPLASVGGVSLNLQYNSRVSSLVRSANSTSGSGWVGLGWTLSTGSIIGTIGGTKDTSDDHYQLVDAGGTSDLVKGSSGSYLIRQHKVWDIRRVIASGVIVGWEIKTEDGTIMRYGNYDKSSGSWIFPSYGPTYATRCAIGTSGVVENPRYQDYGSVELIPVQWDLSDIQDPGGKHTTIIYQQTQAPLSVNGSSTSVSYTVESHPYKIQDEQGGEIEFVLGTMNSDEYYAEMNTYFQNVYEMQFLDTLKIKRNMQVFQRINLKYSSQDILSKAAKKRYLSEIDIYDRSDNMMRYGSFDYWGNGSISPGALQRISYHAGGKQEFSYKSQRASSISTNYTVTISDSIEPNDMTLPNSSGLSGKDFFVVSSALYTQGGKWDNFYFGWDVFLKKPIQIYRFGALGWYRDTTFPYDSSANTFVINDYVVGIFGGVWKAVREIGSGWAVYDLDSALSRAGATNVLGSAAKTKDIAGFTPDYFVVKYKRSWGGVNLLHTSTCSLAVVRFEDDGLHAELLTGVFQEARAEAYDNSGYATYMITAEGSSTYLVVNSVDPNYTDPYTRNGCHALETHWKRSNGQWKKLIDRAFAVSDPFYFMGTSGAIFPSTPPRYAIGANFVVCLYPEWNGSTDATMKVYHLTGDAIDSVDTAHVDRCTVPIVGDDYYGIAGTNQLLLPWYKQWNGSSFDSKVFLNSIFTNLVPSSCSWQRFTNRLIIMWADAYRVRTAVSIIGSNGAWSSPIVKESSFNQTGPTPTLRILPVSGNSIVTVYDGSTQNQSPPGRMYWRLNLYSFTGDSLEVRLLRQSWWEDAGEHAWGAPVNDPGCSRTFQPGNNFFSTTWTNPLGCPPGYNLADTVKIYSRVLDSAGCDSYGTAPYDIVLDKKYSISGMGDTSITQYTFENGAFEESMTSGKYNKTTVRLPENGGKKTTYFYNGLDADHAGEFVSATNYRELNGRAYREKDSSSSGALLREQVSQWSAEQFDLPNRGVFFVKQLKDSVITDGVSKVTSYDYENASHLQVTKITEANGTLQRITKMKYPLDYASTSPSSPDAMVRTLDSMKTVRHIVNAVVEKEVIQDSAGVQKVLASDLVKFRGFGANQILPEQQLKLRATAGIPVGSFTVSSASASSFTYDANYSLVHTFDLYSPVGQVIQEGDANSVKTTTKWGYSLSAAQAQIAGARDAECSVLDFEDTTTGDWLQWDWTPPYSSTYTTTSHTGQLGWSVTSNDYEGVFKFIPGSRLTTNTKYTLSAWVNTSSTYPHLLWEVIYHDSQGVRHDDYPGGLYASGTGSWQYLELSLNLSSTTYPTIDTVVIFVLNGDWVNHVACTFDDIRFAPATSLVEAATYDPLILLQTSATDPGGTITFTTYDGFGRPLQMKNTQGALIKEFSYYYSTDAHSGSFLASDPNYTREKSYRTATDTTTAKTYTDGLGREIQKQISYGDSDIVAVTKYDSLSHPRYVYKPYQVGLGASKHTYDGSFSSNLSTYYTGLGITLGSTPYSETRYYQDPLNRVQYQGAPGDPFSVGSGHEIRVDYSGDQANKWKIVQTRNEQGDTTRVSKDLFGNTVKSEVLMGSAPPLGTSFNYNVLGNLTQSTPPNGSSYNSTYLYNTLGQLGQKTSPDAGTAQYLYDKAGNVRLIRDAAHTGSGANSVYISTSIAPGGQTTNSFTLNNRGKVNVTLDGPGVPVMGGSVTLQVKTSGGVVMLTLVTTGAPQAGSLILPQGTYSYTVRSTAQVPPSTPYLIQCQTQYPFTFTKYDSLYRPIQQGEYEASDASNFTQAQAEMVTFPTSSYLLTKAIFYDTVSTDAMAATQRNVKGRLSYSCSYRLGALALTTFYSYDDMGRIEWVVQKGLGSASKRIAYAYDQQGNLTQKTYTDAYNSLNNHIWWYEYDPAGRMVRVFSGVDYATRAKEAECAYLATGREAQLALGIGPAQTVGYTYNQRDWTTSITSSKFWETLGYESVQRVGSAVSAPAQYGGNISWMAYAETGNPFTWGATTTDSIGYGFFYDKSSRLTAGKFGYKLNNSWSTCNSYNMPCISYDKNGNIDSLVRYGTNATLMDNLKYRYLANTNRLDYITDAVGAATFTTDIDNQTSGAYAYDGNGNVLSDASRSMALVVYDMNNLPVSEYKTDGTLIQYVYDANGTRVQKTVGAASPVWYVGGSDGKTDLVYNGSTSNPCYNVFGPSGLIGQVKRSGVGLSRQYHLKDHLGTVRMTVSPTMIVENFGSDLSQWTTVLGSGFAIESGWLSASSAGSDNVMVNSSSTTISDGVVCCDVSNPMPLPSFPDVSIVVRYVDTNNFYLVYPCNNRLKIWKKLSGTYSLMTDMTLPDGIMTQGTWYHMQITLSGSNIKVSWNGQQVVNWTDPSNPFLSGKVGFRQDNSYHAHWDNFVAWSTTSPTVVAYDDYYPFGQYMDTRSYNAGFSDARYKYTEKERDAETGYDYFGARYYDARVGRFLSVDPHASGYLEISPYVYGANNPMAVVDPTGMDTTSGQQASALALAPAALSIVVQQAAPQLLEGVVTASSLVAGAVAWMATTFSGDAPPDALQTLQATDKASGDATSQGGDKAEGTQSKSGEQKQGKAEAQTNTEKARGGKTVQQVIKEECQGKINREMPSQFLDKTVDQLKQLKNQGDVAARKAWKLLNDSRFKK